MSILLSSSAIELSSSSGGTNIFDLTAGSFSSANVGFVRGLYGAITPDETYDGESLQALVVSDNTTEWEYQITLAGDWNQGDLSLDVDGVFLGAAVGTLLGSAASSFSTAPGGPSSWLWQFPSESMMISGNIYACTVVWDRT